MAETARNDLQDKLDLEAKLLTAMRGLFKRAARELRSALRTGQPHPDMRILLQSSIEARLKQHFRRCERVFGTNLQDQFADDIKPGPVEKQFIEVEILRILDARAERQSQMISNSTQNLAAAAIQKANFLIVKNEDLTLLDLPALAGNLFFARTQGQARAIAITETQMGSETCKGVEAIMLVGQSTIEVKRLSDIIVGKKTWRSQGDSRVRTATNGSPFDHLAVDGQRVGSTETFLVGGERLGWPGDVSHGASVGNIINCRCSAIYDPLSFASLRRSWLGRLFEDVLRPFRQTESVNVVGAELGL